MRLWDVASRRQFGAPIAVQGLGYKGISKVVFSPDGRTLAIICDDGSLRLWDVAGNRQIGAPLTATIGYLQSDVYFGCVAFSPDQHTLTAAGAGDGYGGVISRWDVASRVRTDEAPPSYQGVDCTSISSDGRTLVASTRLDTNTGPTEQNALQLFDPANANPVGNPLTGHTDKVISAAFSADGRTVATGSKDQTARLWDAATGKQIGSPMDCHHTEGDTSYPGDVTSVAVSPDSHTVATGSQDGVIRLWNAG
uniref:WD40 repeat domain-containing protein n=1 Tax=Amycolatopsis sp. CA-096443 TaxID=3239919 RepID=UPI003F49A9DD